MIIFKKERLFLIFSCVMVSLFVFSFKIADKEDLVATVSLPISNKVIIIDAGHGEPDGGAVSNNGTTESQINLKIALKVQSLLEQSGSTVILTRSDENGISDASKSTIRQKHVSDIHNRVKIGNESSADVFVSIHLNKISQSQYSGWQAFYKKENEDSKRLATSLQNGLDAAIQKENKREPAKISGIYIVDHVEIPLSIVECGFLSNPEEEKLLQQDEYQDRLAWGIYNGIIEYFYELEK